MSMRKPISLLTAAALLGTVGSTGFAGMSDAAELTGPVQLTSLQLDDITAGRPWRPSKKNPPGPTPPTPTPPGNTVGDQTQCKGFIGVCGLVVGGPQVAVFSKDVTQNQNNVGNFLVGNIVRR